MAEHSSYFTPIVPASPGPGFEELIHCIGRREMSVPLVKLTVTALAGIDEGIRHRTPERWFFVNLLIA